MKNNLKIIFIFVSLLVCKQQLYAQQNNNIDFSKSLKVGDDFVPPESVLLMRGKDKTIDWNALKDKVVLLDFFDTFCGTCIQIMPKLQELERKYPDKIKVVTITWQDKATMEKLFASNKYLKEHQVDLPIIYNDTYFKSAFPHIAVPHEVLIYKGKVHAITSSASITEDNLLKLYADNSISLPLKDDFGKGNLFNTSNDHEKGIKAGVLFSGYQEGVPYQTWTFEQDSLSGLYKSSFFNYSIYGALLSLAAQAKIKDITYMPRMDRVVWKVQDSTKYCDFENIGVEWLLKNAISYERYDLRGRPDSIQAKLILADFLSFYGLKTYEEVKMIPCLVLSACPVVPFKGERSQNKMTYKGSLVFSMFLDFSGKFPPTVDNVNYNGKMEIGDFESLADLNQQLASYGIKAALTDAPKKVLVIEEVDQ